MLRVQGNVRPKTTLLQGTSVVRLQKEPHLLLFVCLLQPVDVWECSTNGALSILARHNRQSGDNQYGAGSDLGRNAFKLRPITHPSWPQFHRSSAVLRQAQLRFSMEQTRLEREHLQEQVLGLLTHRLLLQARTPLPHRMVEMQISNPAVRQGWSKM